MFCSYTFSLSCLLPVHLSLPLSSSLPACLSDESLMTPDAENAVVSPILPFLFLGNERDAQDLDLLVRLNIGYVVNVTTHLPLYHVNSGLRYKRLPATDNSKQNLRQYFEEVFEFIGETPICWYILIHGQLEDTYREFTYIVGWVFIVEDDIYILSTPLEHWWYVSLFFHGPITCKRAIFKDTHFSILLQDPSCGGVKQTVSFGIKMIFIGWC